MHSTSTSPLTSINVNDNIINFTHIHHVHAMWDNYANVWVCFGREKLRGMILSAKTKDELEAKIKVCKLPFGAARNDPVKITYL